MKSLLLLLVSISLALKLIAQNDPNAKKILDAVTNKAKSIAAFEAFCNLAITTQAGKNAGTKTYNLLRKGPKYVLKDKSTEIYCNGDTKWIYDITANEVTVTTCEAEAELGLLSFGTDFYDKHFSYKLNGNKPVGGKTLAEIELMPTEKNKNYNKVYVYVDQVQNWISSFKVIENSGNSYSYTTANLKINTTAEDDAFTFNTTMHPGTKIVLTKIPGEKRLIRKQ